MRVCGKKTAAVLLALLPAAVVPAVAAEEAGPRIEVEQETVDLGQVVLGETAEAVFLIRNTGAEVLKILSARPG